MRIIIIQSYSNLSSKLNMMHMILDTSQGPVVVNVLVQAPGPAFSAKVEL